MDIEDLLDRSWTACVRWPLCARTFLQIPLSDRTRFEYMMLRLLDGDETLLDDVLAPILGCGGGGGGGDTLPNVSNITMRLWLHFLVRNEWQQRQCAVGQTLVVHGDGTATCVCAGPHRCHQEEPSRSAVFIVMFSAIILLLVLLYTHYRTFQNFRLYVQQRELAK